MPTKFDWSDLEQLYIGDGLSTSQIAQVKGCAPQTVSWWLRRKNIDVRRDSHALRLAYQSGVLKSKKVPFDTTDVYDLYVNRRLSGLRIAKLKGLQTASPIYRELRNLGISRRSRSQANALTARKGADNPFWKGGRVRTTQGYLKILCPDHPYADCNGYVLEHRLVMEKKLGRYLMPWEIPHHKNGVRDDNTPENLELVTPAGNVGWDRICKGCAVRKQVKALQRRIKELEGHGSLFDHSEV
jgi:hypothetical protein